MARWKPETERIFAYVGCRTTKERNARGKGIQVYRIDAAFENWTPVQLVEGLENPSYLAFDCQHHFLYAVHGDGCEVSAFKVCQRGGLLTFLGRQATGGRNPVHLCVDATNRFLVVANYATGSVAVLPIHPDGTLSPPSDVYALPGNSGPHKIEQTSAHPHQVLFDPTGRFIIVPDKGLDRIFILKLDTSTGRLIASDPPFVATREGAGPRHGNFHPIRPYLYIVNELDSTVTTYRYDLSGGEITPIQVVSTLPQRFTGNSRAAGIAVSSSGSCVFVSNRGHDSVAMLAIKPDTGMLTPLGWTPCRGTTPRFITRDPSMKILCVANENSDNIVFFQIDEATGELAPTKLGVETGSPVCIVFNAQGTTTD